MTIYDSLFKKIQSDIVSYGGELQPPATGTEIQMLQDQAKNELEVNNKHYEAWKLAFYGVAVGAGGTFAIAKTLQLLGAGQL